MENLNLKAVQITSGAIAAAALLFGIIPVGETRQSNPCGSVFFKSKYAEFCESQYPVNAGLLVVILLVAAAACIYATLASNSSETDAAD